MTWAMDVILARSTSNSDLSRGKICDSLGRVINIDDTNLTIL
jgi:hypothetical protein